MITEAHIIIMIMTVFISNNTENMLVGEAILHITMYVCMYNTRAVR